MKLAYSFFVMGCVACGATDGAASSSTGTPIGAASSTVSSRPSAPSSAAVEESASASPSTDGVEAAEAQLTGENATWLKGHGFQRLCTERVYPPPPNPHLTWWGWTSTQTPDAVFDSLTLAFPTATADKKTHTLRFTAAGASSPTIVASVADAQTLARQAAGSPDSIPTCKEALPPAAKSFINLSQRAP